MCNGTSANEYLTRLAHVKCRRVSGVWRGRYAWPEFGSNTAESARQICRRSLHAHFEIDFKLKSCQYALSTSFDKEREMEMQTLVALILAAPVLGAGIAWFIVRTDLDRTVR